MNRRKFIKYAGLASGSLAMAGVSAGSFMAGRSKDSYTGWGRTPYGKDQFFNRTPFLVEKPTYQIVGKPERITYVENIFRRNSEFFRLLMNRHPDGITWDKSQGIEGLPEPLKTYYTNHPSAFEEFFRMREKAREQRTNWPKYKDKYHLADAWSTAHSSFLGGPALFPAEPSGPPEEADFKGVNPNPLPLKSPEHGSKLIKKIAHSFGATLVGIARIKKEWVYQGSLRGVGRVDFEVPEHWKNAVVFAVPHEWESFYANPVYGTSYDAYSMLRFISGKLEVFIKEIGYSARSHVPPGQYDLIMPPLGIDAGLGELGRNGILITPELGGNTRLAAISTDMPLIADKPIDAGINKFCKKCKICADECPSGSISFDDAPKHVIRGFKRWKIDQDKCYTAWNSFATSHAKGCRICLAVCPYSRKNNWIHTLAREVDPRDPTGVTSKAMLEMQKNFFDYPGANEYLPPPDGNNKTFGKPPDWLLTEEWFDV